MSLIVKDGGKKGLPNKPQETANTKGLDQKQNRVDCEF